MDYFSNFHVVECEKDIHRFCMHYFESNLEENYRKVIKIWLLNFLEMKERVDTQFKAVNFKKM